MISFGPDSFLAGDKIPGFQKALESVISDVIKKNKNTSKKKYCNEKWVRRSAAKY